MYDNKINKMMKVINSVKPGSFVRIEYKTELPVKSEYKKFGYRVYKVSQMTTRLGIKYSNMKSVVKTENSVPNRPSTMHFINKYVLKNENNENLYLATYPCQQGRNNYSIYIVINENNKDINMFNESEDIKDLVIDSYWNKKGSNNYFVINLNNVKKIGKNKFED